MKRRDFLARAALGLTGLPAFFRTARAEKPCPPSLTVEGGSSAASPVCGEPASFSIGQIMQDAETPEQISLYAPVAGVVTRDVYATVRYRLATDEAYSQAHPLVRIDPGGTNDAFAGVIFDLLPGMAYDVEVTFIDKQASDVRAHTFNTRPLPRIAGTPTSTSSSISELESAIAAASPGDVIELNNGNYSLSKHLIIEVSGAPTQPIYVRGQSQDGTIINTNGNSVQLLGDFLVFENMTLDHGGSANAPIVLARDASPYVINVTDCTIRDVVSLNSNRGIMTWGGTSGATANRTLIYNNSFTGNGVWNETNIITNAYWSEDGLRIVGTGNCVWNNTLEGFGDTITFSHSVADSNIKANFAYRNFIRNSFDDAFEFDYGVRNMAAYDNYVENCNVLMSLDDRPIDGGSIWCFRNTAVNIHARPFKLNDNGNGYLIYNNTMLRAECLNADQSFYGFGFGKLNLSVIDRFTWRNNLFIYRGVNTRDVFRLRTMAYQADSEVEWTHNAHFPDGSINWEADVGQDVFPSLADAQANIRATNPIWPTGAGLGAPTRRHENDVITVSDPFVSPITMGTDGSTEVSGRVTPILSAQSSPKNAGVAIPGITDGYVGLAPDIGAIVEGREVPNWGASV